jgi:hypothetical protein
VRDVLANGLWHGASGEGPEAPILLPRISRGSRNLCSPELWASVTSLAAEPVAQELRWAGMPLGRGVPLCARPVVVLVSGTRRSRLRTPRRLRVAGREQRLAGPASAGCETLLQLFFLTPCVFSTHHGLSVKP